MKFDKIYAGDVLLDIHSQRMGNTTMRQLGCWKVRIISIDSVNETAMVSWNGNRPEMWTKKQLKRLRKTESKAYREQEARKTSRGHELVVIAPAHGPKWFNRERDGVIADSLLGLEGFALRVHRHRDEDPQQWFVTCFKLGIERQPVGASGIAIESAQPAAVAFITAHLRTALQQLEAL